MFQTGMMLGLVGVLVPEADHRLPLTRLMSSLSPPGLGGGAFHASELLLDLTVHGMDDYMTLIRKDIGCGSHFPAENPP